MGTVSITIQNRSYRLSCGDGEEARLTELAEYVRAKAEQLVTTHGRITDEHLMLMSAVLIADELWDQRAASDTQAAPTRKRKTAVKKAPTAEATPPAAKTTDNAVPAPEDVANAKVPAD